MIKIVKSESEYRCLSCFSRKNVYEIAVKLDNSGVTNSVALCRNCLVELKKKIKVEVENETRIQ